MRLGIEDVAKEYRGGVWGIRDFSLAAGPGLLGLLGPNGAGKSTLMRILATITRPTHGRVLWDGADIARDPDPIRAVLGYLPQDFGVYPNLSAVEFLEYMVAVGRRRGWGWAVAGALLVAGLVTPLETARGRVLPLAWLWPVLVWSSMGSREVRHATGPIVFSAPRSLARELPAAWLAGVLVALAAGASVGLRLLVSGERGSAIGFVVGAIFVPTLALALGVWTGGGRAFEALYTALWYLGPVQPLPALDYMAASPLSVAQGMPLVYVGLTAALLVAAVAGRWRQIRG